MPSRTWSALDSTDLSIAGADCGTNSTGRSALAGSIGAATPSFSTYDGSEVDAAILVMAEVGFLPPTDPRILGTLAAIEEDLLRDGFVDRYRTDTGVDGLPRGEGAFLLCTFWLADNYALTGRSDDARRIFENLLSIRNDIGLLAEEYDPIARRQLGNFPQAFSHLGLINTARNLTQAEKPAAVRQQV